MILGMDQLGLYIPHTGLLTQHCGSNLMGAAERYDLPGKTSAHTSFGRKRTARFRKPNEAPQALRHMLYASCEPWPALLIRKLHGDCMGSLFKGYYSSLKQAFAEKSIRACELPSILSIVGPY